MASADKGLEEIPESKSRIVEDPLIRGSAHGVWDQSVDLIADSLDL